MTGTPTESEIGQLLNLLEKDATDEQNRAVTLGYLGSRILTAIHSQLIGTSEFGVLAEYEMFFALHPVEMEERLELALHDCRGRFVVGEVRSGKSNRLRFMAWQLLAILLEDEAHGQAVNRWDFDTESTDEELFESVAALDELRDAVLLTPWEQLDRDIRARQAFIKNLENDFRVKDDAGVGISVLARLEEQIERTRESIEQLVHEREESIRDHHEFLIDGTSDEPLVAGGRQAEDSTYLTRLLDIFERDQGREESPSGQLLGRYLVEVGRVYKKWVDALKRLPEGSLRACPYLWLEDHDGLERFYLKSESSPQW